MPTPAAPTLPAVSWDSGKQGGFVTALTGDRQGHIWVGTEDDGVARFDPAAPPGQQWTQFTAKSTGGGLGDDDCYSLTCDRLGRIWVGTLNHGVSVFTGRQWKAYDQMTGPLGCHVVALATSPLDGDIWGSSEAGIFRYSLRKNSWTYYTRADGLPSDQSTCLAFTRTGTLLAGTDCDGIALASPTNNYQTWRVVRGPEQMPVTRRGRGLPTSLINCLLVSREGTIYAGTTTGLARSVDGGDTWKFVRGDDWRDKVRGLYHGPQPVAAATDKTGILEDYVTSLAEDGAGRLYVGHRRLGLEVLDPDTGARVDDAKSAYGGFVDALLLTSSGGVFIGTYGDGLRQTQWTAPDVTRTASRPLTSIPPLRLPAAPPTLTQMRATLAQLTHIPAPPPSEQPTVAALDDDWMTQGTWVDRYGDFAAILCAMNGGGNDQVRGYRAAWVDHRGWVGRNGSDGDYLRYYVAWRHTDDPRSLQNMLYGGRTEAEWDDRGEKKAMSMDGPNVYGTLKVPRGRYVLSCYEFNKDGHGSSNRWRDYLLTVKATPMTDAQFAALGSPVGVPGREQEALFDAAPGGASSRVRDFWGGVWKRFYVDMPEDGYVTVKVGRNYSFNTILPGLFLDPVGELCGPQGPVRQPAHPRQAAFVPNVKSSSDMADVCMRLMDRLLVLRDTDSVWYEAHSREFLLLLVRRLLNKTTTSSCLAAQIEVQNIYAGLRPDAASCLRDVQLFDLEDRVHFSPDHYATWTWQRLTQRAAQFNYGLTRYISLDPWNDEEYDSFLRSQQSKQAW